MSAHAVTAEGAEWAEVSSPGAPFTMGMWLVRLPMSGRSSSSATRTVLKASSAGQDPDLWIAQLYDALCDHISQLTDLPPGTKPGFMDRELRQGQEWPWRLSNALATCRVFVPLYSKRYFKSEHCGREWFAFHRRAINHAAANGAGRWRR